MTNCPIESVTVEAKSATGKPLRTSGLQTVWEVVNYKLRNPDATQAEIAQAVGITREHCNRLLNTDYARSRIEQTYDIRPIIASGLRRTALNSMDYMEKVTQKGTTELDKSKPNPHVLASATQSAKAILAGTGVLQEHIRLEQLPTDDAAKLLEQLLQDKGEGETDSTR